MTSTHAHAPAVARSGGGATPHAGQVRLTRRGRLVVLGGALLLLVALVLGFGLTLDRSAATDEAGSPPATRTVTVSPGETLWELAGPLAEAGVAGGDVRSVVQEIEQLNDLESAMLLAGQELRVPDVE